MTFIIPMAGDSRRFSDAGHDRPKFMLPLAGGFLFDHAVASFAAYFPGDEFVFVLRSGAETENFVRERCRLLGIARAQFVFLDHPTLGQAQTVLLGLDRAKVANDESILVFNIDTFRPGYLKPNFLPFCDGYLEVFRGDGANWSFVAPDSAGRSRVVETSEKRPISDLCCTGLYHFRAAGDFRWAWNNPAPPQGEAERRERYVAPLYNALIGRGRDIRFDIVARGEVIFCGTPEEYDQLEAAPEILARLARDA